MWDASRRTTRPISHGPWPLSLWEIRRRKRFTKLCWKHTGHGIGLSTHEPPYIVKGNNEPLKPGMCFSVEPGIYLQGKFGVRIENIVTMTADGVRSLNAEPADHLRVVG